MGTAIAVPQNLTPPQRRFLRCFEASSSVTQAARWAKVNRRTHYDWLDASEAYRVAFAASEKVASRTLEDEAVRRAHQGLRQAVWYKGRVVGYETEYSDTLMALLLKGNNKAKFGDTSTTKVIGGGPGGVIDIGLTDLTRFRETMLNAAEKLPDEVKAQIAAQLMAADKDEENG